MLYSLTTISGPPLALYFKNQGMVQDELKVALALTRSIESLATLVAYAALGMFTAESTALVPWLVRAESPRLDQLLLDWIQRECPGSRWSSGLADDIMRGLLERPSPLEAEDAVRTLLDCTASRTASRFADGIPISAYLLLIHWQVPGAAERLLARPCEPGTDCLADLLNSETVDHPLPASLRATLEALASAQGQ